MWAPLPQKSVVWNGTNLARHSDLDKSHWGHGSTALYTVRYISIFWQDYGFLFISSRPWQTRYGLTSHLYVWRFFKDPGTLFAFKVIDFIILYSFKSGGKGRGWEAAWWEGSPLLTALLQSWTPSRRSSFQLCGPSSLSRRKQGILEGITGVPGFLSSWTSKCRVRKDNAGRAIEAKLLTRKQGTIGKTNG